MCYQLVERYSVCRCLYYRHAIDPCRDYGKYGHSIQEKTVLVGYACPTHSVRRTPITEIKEDQNPTETHPDNIDAGALTAQFSREAQIEDVESSTLSEPESVISSNTSQSLSVSDGSSSSSISVDYPQTFQDAAQELGEIFYDNQIIGPLLHLHFERDGPPFSNIFIKLLRQYSVDLRKAASSQLEKAAYRLVRSHAPLIARTVQSRLGYPLLSLFDDRRKQLEQVEGELAKLQDVESDSDEEAEEKCPALSSVKRFLLDGKAFRKLRRNLQTRSDLTEDLQSEDPFQDPSGNRGSLLVDKSFKGVIQALVTKCSLKTIARVLHIDLRRSSVPESPSEPGRVRGRWRCCCGKVFHDHYLEEIPYAVKALEAHLDTAYTGAQGNPTRKGSAGSFKEVLSWMSTALATLFGITATKRETLPLSTNQTPNLQPRAGVSPNRLLFLLTCLKLGTAPVLSQQSVCEINSDREFFQFLRSIRKNSRSGLRSLFAFNKVVHIRFVHFELFPNDLVNVLAEDCPPVDSGYIPVKDTFATFPPVGSSILVHLYENPHHADLSKLLLGRIPKKLDTELRICQIKRQGTGWGLELVEGLDWRKLWIVGLTAFVVSGAFGVLWSVLRRDIQGGWAISACMMMFIPFLTGTLHAAYGQP